MKIAQVRLRKGNKFRVCWVRLKRRKPVSGMLVKMPDGEVWVVDEVYETKEEEDVHDAHPHE